MEPEEYESIYQLEQRHWWYQGMRDLSLALLDQHLPHRRPLSVLDAGCGTGGMMLALERYGSITGVDFSPIALKFCRKRSLTRAALASVTDLPFRDAAFDLVTSFEVLYHLGVADDTQAFREFARVLRPDGVLLVRLPAFEWLRSAHDATVHTRHRYTTTEVGAKVEAAGLRVVRLSYANSLLFPLAAAVRVGQRLAGHRETKESDVRETSPLANRALLGVLHAEAALLARTDLPAGLSVVCLARKD